MNSGELAALSGVTVRAMRHYHQIGVLPEPPRASNGYRQYGVHELIRVLQIKRLTALGIALERIPEILDGTRGEATPVLDELERELTSQIDRLTAQREIVSELRSANAAPDHPPELARFLVALSALRASPEAARIDRDQSILLAHLAGPEGMPELVGLYSRISSPDLLPAMARIATHFDDVDASATDAEMADLVEEFATVLGPLARELIDAPTAVDWDGSAPLLEAYGRATLNDAQRRLLTMIETRLDNL